MRKKLGLFLIALPFLAGAVLAADIMGWRDFLTALLVAVAIFGCVTLGVYLHEG